MDVMAKRKNLHQLRPVLITMSTRYQSYKLRPLLSSWPVRPNDQRKRPLDGKMSIQGGGSTYNVNKIPILQA